jgi:hypothetical protein
VSSEPGAGQGNNPALGCKLKSLHVLNGTSSLPHPFENWRGKPFDPRLNFTYSCHHENPEVFESKVRFYFEEVLLVRNRRQFWQKGLECPVRKNIVRKLDEHGTVTLVNRFQVIKNHVS